MHDDALSQWPDVRAWRRAERERLLSRRIAVPPAEKKACTATIAASLKDAFPELTRACIGFYWPFRGEHVLQPVVEHFLERGATAALPVVVEKARPLEFRAWRPGMKLVPGVWSIPVPPAGDPVQPTALLVPLVGFDDAGFRLGYGGGYYDRTLAAMADKPLAIGIGYDFARLATIDPQPHDIAMDAIVTETGIERTGRSDITGHAPSSAGAGR